MLSIVFGVILLIILVYKRVSVIIAAPLALALVSILNNYSPLHVLTGEYVEGVTFFIEDFLLIFILGAILGKVMTDSGAAQTIAYFIINNLGAKRGNSAVLITSALLTYGGIPGFVIVFTIYPISLPVFKEGNLPRYFLPACFAGGVGTFALPMPGSPQVHNIIPIETLGTTPMAGLIPGVIGTGTSFILALIYLEFRAKRAKSNGDGYLTAEAETNHYDQDNNRNEEVENNPGIIRSLTPLLVVVGSLTLGGVTVITALTLGVIMGIVLFFHHLESILTTLNQGTRDSLTPLLFASSAVGFGLTLRAFPAFDSFLQEVIALSINPIITSSIITNLGAAMMGSASGGIMLTMSLIGEGLITYSDPANLHRIITMASAVFDTVPFNNGYLAILAFTGLSLKDTYLDYFVVTVLAPLIGLLVAIGIITF